MIPDDAAQLIKLIIDNRANQSSIENNQKHESELKAKHGED
jgi:hypothetical protein